MAERGRKRLFTDEQLIELYEKGFNDREIGEKLGADTNTVGERRRRLGLKPIRKTQSKPIANTLMSLTPIIIEL